MFYRQASKAILSLLKMGLQLTVFVGLSAYPKKTQPIIQGIVRYPFSF